MSGNSQCTWGSGKTKSLCHNNIGKSEKYLVQTWSQTKSSGIKLLEVHGVSKNLDPNIQPEKQNIKPLKGNDILQEKPRIGQGRAGTRRPPPIYQTNVAETSRKIPEAPKIKTKITNQPDFTHTPVQSITSTNEGMTHRRPIIKDIPFYPDPTYRPPPKLTRILTSESQENIDISPEINIDFKENSPFQEGVISETFQRCNKSFFQEPQELKSLVNTSNLVQKFLPKLADMDKRLKSNSKKGTHLLVSIK